MSNPSIDWKSALQEEARQRLAESEPPVRTNQNWRFADLRKSDISSFSPAQKVSGDELARILDGAGDLEKRSARVVFANHDVVSSKVDFKDGFVGTFEQASEEQGRLIREEIQKAETRLGGNYFQNVQQSNQLSGLFIHIPRGVVVEHPIEIERWVCGDDAAVFPATVIVAEDQAQVIVVERIRCLGDRVKLVVGSSSISASGGAHVTHITSQELNEKSKHVHFFQNNAGRDANIRTFVGNFGCGWVRQEAVSEILGPGANVEMFGLNPGHDDQEIDQRTHQHHRAGNSRSDLLFKNALYDSSKTVFSGLILVDEVAHQTDAFQSCRNLLLSDEAEANSLPGLEINADQVRCSHGATTSQIDPEEVFYLKARGIPEDRARELVTFGYGWDVIQRIGHPEIQEIIGERFQERIVAARD